MAALRGQLALLGVHDADEQLCGGVVEALRERAKTMKEMAQGSLFFFREPVMDEKAVAKHLTAEGMGLLGELARRSGRAGRVDGPCIARRCTGFCGSAAAGSRQGGPAAARGADGRHGVAAHRRDAGAAGAGEGAGEGRCGIEISLE